MSDHYVLIDHVGGPNGNMFGSRSCMIWGPSQNGSHHECRETLSKDSLFSYPGNKVVKNYCWSRVLSLELKF